MKVGIQTYGSRGDINPWIALGQGLARAGHQVNLYYTNYSGGNFNHYAIDGLAIHNTQELDPDSGVYEKVERKKIYALDAQALTDYTVREIYDLFAKEVILAAEILCSASDVFISTPYLFQSSCIAEKYAIPRINLVVECQFSPKNRVSHIDDEQINAYLLPQVNAFRQQLDLSPVTSVRAQVLSSTWLNLLAYSHLFKRDEDQWGEKYQFCGYLPLEKEGEECISPELETFIAAGEAPILFSMGSLAFFEGENYDILDIFLAAIAVSGCRAIIQMDWINCQRCLPADNNILAIDYIPHGLVLPLCSGLVHHGGAGTTHTALMHGCPSIVIAYAWDQFYWAEELQRIGCCAGALKRNYLDAIQLAGALRQLMCDPSFTRAAVAAKRSMKREKGIAKAVKLVETAMQKYY